MTARQGAKTGLLFKIISMITWIPVIVGRLLPSWVEKNGIAIDNLFTQWFMGLLITIMISGGGYLLYLGLYELKIWWDD